MTYEASSPSHAFTESPHSPRRSGHGSPRGWAGCRSFARGTGPPDPAGPAAPDARSGAAGTAEPAAVGGPVAPAPARIRTDTGSGAVPAPGLRLPGEHAGRISHGGRYPQTGTPRDEP